MSSSAACTVQRPADADFLALARTGRTEWWRWVLGLVLILVFWLVLGGIPSAVRAAMGDSSTDGYGFYLVVNLSFVFFFLGIWLAVAKVHRRGLRTLVTPHRQVSLATIGAGFLCWVAATVIVVGVSVLFGARPQWALDPARFFLFVRCRLAACATPRRPSCPRSGRPVRRAQGAVRLPHPLGVSRCGPPTARS